MYNTRDTLNTTDLDALNTVKMVNSMLHVFNHNKKPLACPLFRLVDCFSYSEKDAVLRNVQAEARL